MTPQRISEEELSLRLLEHIQEHPESTQAGMAAQLGVAVGSVNWYLKRLIRKGYVKVSKLQRRRLRYLLTPHGLAEKSRLALAYMDASLHAYRHLRTRAKRVLGEVSRRGYARASLEGDGDAADILRLTCLEYGIRADGPSDGCPTIRLDGLDWSVDWPKEDG